jgi:hypothetical protein
LDQLERRHCKDTPFFRPFYIGAPKGPFLPGLSLNFSQYSIKTWSFCSKVRDFCGSDQGVIYFKAGVRVQNLKSGHFTVFHKNLVHRMVLFKSPEFL